jgi:hypothetical protein
MRMKIKMQINKNPQNVAKTVHEGKYTGLQCLLLIVDRKKVSNMQFNLLP